MAKESGLGATVSVDDNGGTARNISNDFTTFNYDTPRALQDITGVDKSAHERLHLLADFTVSGTTVFNDAANMEHDVFKNLANTRTWNTVISGQTLSCETLIGTAGLTRAAGGELTRSVSASLQSGTVPAWS